MDDRRPPAGWTRPPERNPLATPLFAGLLAAVLVALVAAIFLVPGLLPGSAAAPTPRGSGTGASAAPEVTAPSPPPGAATPSPPASFVRPTPTPLPTFRTYVVRAGDSLNSIADAFLTSARSIAWWNRGTYPNLDPQSDAYDPNHIEPGWVLVLIPTVTVDEAHPPTPSPGPATPPATAGPSTGPSSSPATSEATPFPGGPATVISHGPRGSAQVALTFDMGGRLDPAVEIVRWLVDHDVHAMLFPTGKAGTTTTEGRAALELAATRPDLFDFGNHSWDHPDFTTLTAAQVADQLGSTEAAIRDLVGTSTVPWFRPPYGAWTEAVRVRVGAAGWSRLVLWDVDTIDWQTTANGGPTADEIVTKVVTAAQGGSIVLMHLGGWHTLEALPGLIAGLGALGLTPVTLDELFRG